MNNAEVARVFDEVADLLEIQGAEGFRVTSYRRVARTIGDLAEDIHAVAGRGALAELPGVGKGSAGKIQELLTTGRLGLREELCREVPESLLRLLAVPTLGPKKIAALWKERGIRGVDDLKAALAAGALEGLRGFGAKSVEQIRRGLEFIERCAGRTHLGTGWYLAERLMTAVRAMPGVTRVEVAGSLRRGRETIGDLDLLCTATNGEEVVRRFTELPGIQAVLGAGGTKASVQIELCPGQPLQVDLRVVPAESFGAAWQYFTGSKEHNVRLRERAQRHGWSLNEYGLTHGAQVLASHTEEEIYGALGLPWIPPELREDRGEFELREAADLLREEDVRGDLHMHTVASDGRCTLAELVAGARARGYAYVCVTEHSQSSVIANGLKPERLRAHIAEVRAAAQQYRDITVWVGTEVDILADGRLDYADELLAELDFVIASIHSGFSSDAEHNTQRILAALENPYVNAIGHLTGRIINEREALPMDFDAIAAAAARTGTALEINANYYRLDLKDQHVRRARESGALLVINTDAHAVDQLEQMRFGVITARRGWARAADVVNAWPATRVMEFVRRKRTKAETRV